MEKIKKILGLLIFTSLLMVSCKNSVLYGPDPYAGGKEPNTVRFAPELPIPSEGKTGTEMVFKVYGAAKYKGSLKFFISGINSEITDVTDSTITAILPENVSTGGSSLEVDGQLFLGPICRVVGRVGIDPTFNAGLGANSTIYSIHQSKDGKVFIGGDFKDYNGEGARGKINGIARITVNGELVPNLSFGAGVMGGAVLSIHSLKDGNVLLSGNILNYDSVSMVSNIVKITPAGLLIKEKVDVMNLTDDPEKGTIDVPVFNGGTSSGIIKSFVQGNTVTVIGDFKRYLDRFYPQSTYNNILIGYFNVGSVVRMHLDGGLDSSFNVNKGSIPATAFAGFAGPVNDGYLDDDGKLIVVGRFSRYNNVAVGGNIVRLNNDGSIDNSFNVGTGANATIAFIGYSTVGKKYFLTGDFLSYNQVSALNVVMLNTDGSVDLSFKSLGFSGGIPKFVRQLTNGLIIVSGSFTKYGDVVREGLCFLNPDGSLAKEYNNTGKLEGQVYDALEGRNSLGQRTVTLVGDIKRFDGISGLGNIIRLSVQD